MRRVLLAASLATFVVAAPHAPGQSLPDSLRVPAENARALAVEAGFRPTTPPPAPVRAVAEFERSEAVLVSYSPLDPVGYWVPLDLVSAISEQVRVIALVADVEEETRVATAYAAAGVNMANVDFAYIPVDFPWIRDNGPLYVTDGNRRISIVDFISPSGDYAPNDNAVPAALGDHLGVPVYAMDLVFEGGNYMATGAGQAASTNLVLDINDGDETLVRQQMRDYLGIEEYYLFPDPQGTYIDHIDTWAKFLDVDKVMITQAEPGHPDHEALEAIAATFEAMPSPWGTPFQVFRVSAPDRQPYTNALIVNDHVYVPIEGSDLDDAALEAYRQAMPGYTVLGFEGIWGSTDALHCRVKEVADTGMLSVRHRPYAGDVPHTTQLTFDAEIIAYSGHPLIEDALHLIYRTGAAPYDTLALERVGPDTFRATVSAPPPGTEVSYYLSASDASGRTERFPLVGPAGPRTFRLAPSTTVDGDMPAFALHLDASPNPATGPISLHYTLNSGGPVTLDVLDLLGRRVALLQVGPIPPGRHRTTWDPHGVAPGMYFVRLTGTHGARAMQRVTIVR